MTAEVQPRVCYKSLGLSEPEANNNGKVIGCRQ